MTLTEHALVTEQDTPHVVIIGGGISGLSAAWHLQQHGLRYTVLEAGSRWGGKVRTDTIDTGGGTQFVVEGGPDSFLTQKPAALQLARELGLANRLLGTNDRLRNTYVLRRGRPTLLPDGVMLIVPTKFRPFALSPLISPLGKLRMGMDLFIPTRKDAADETLADFVLRRLGREALDLIAEPLMSGIYNADADKQSVLATFPRFRQLERDHGSLIKGMLASRAQSIRQGTKPGGPKVSAFMSLEGGTQELISALTMQLEGDLRLHSPVASVQRTAHGYTVTLQSGDTVAADAVIFTTPAYVTADLIRGIAPDAAARLAAIRYVSTGTISLAFPAEAIQRPLNGFGLVVPKSEKRPINAITISSIKFDHRAPGGWVLLRIFFGGSRSPESMALDDQRLLNMVRKELRSILGIEAEPLFHRIYRWMNANPQYDVNHLERITEIESLLPAGLYVAGSAIRGVGMPDCINQSHQTVTHLLENFGQTASA